MIQPNELRIGNWVKDKRDNKQYQFVRINPEFWDATFFEPIPLTPEVLEKCGLKDVWIKNSWMIVEDVSDGETFGWAMKVRNASYTREIEFAYFKYLHQLQNLYFALTGEELEYKP